MAIGKHACREARSSTLKDALALGLDEALTALEESIHDLDEAQLSAFPIPGRNNIAWIAMHCLMNLSEYSGGFQTGRRDIPYARRWDLWQCQPEERPKPGDCFPTRQELLAALGKVRATAEAGLQSATEAELRGKRFAEPWWDKTAADAYLRAICHAAAHVRQIWLLRGALGLTDGRSWPQQHWS
jgi:hypothetical protein